jgi:glycosyltransferase involved in cell wall biosynthesis
MQPQHLLHVFSTFAVGGPQVRFAQLANHFGNRYRHSLLALDGNYACRDRIDRGIALEIVPSCASRSRFLPPLQTLRGLMERVRPDLLVTYNWGSIEWALANRWWPLCGHIHQEDGFGPDEAGRQLRRRILLRRLALRGRHTLVVVPSRTLLRITTAIWGLAERRVRFIPNGIDLERFARPVASVTHGRPPRSSGEVVVGTLAKLRPEKNIGRLIRAFAAIDVEARARLLIVGDGPELDRLKRVAADCGIMGRVEFAGASRVPEGMLARMDVFAISSDTEQMPLGVIEAMAAGLPVAGLAVGDVKEMVAAENQPFIAAGDDEAAFRTALRAVVADAALRQLLGAANRAAAVERFGQDRMFAAYAELFSAPRQPRPRSLVGLDHR